MSSFGNLFQIKRINDEEHPSNSSVQDAKSIAFKIVVTCNTRKAVYIPRLLGKSLPNESRCPSIHIQKRVMLCLFVQRTFHVANMSPLRWKAWACTEVRAKGRSKMQVPASLHFFILCIYSFIFGFIFNSRNILFFLSARVHVDAP